MSIAPRETKCLSSCQRRSGHCAVRALGEDLALDLDRRRVAERAALGRARDRRALLAVDDVRRGREHLRDDVAGAQDDDLVARRAGPCARCPPRCGASRASPSRRRRGRARARRTGAGRRTCRRSTATPLRRVIAVVGGNFQAMAQRGSRPTTPRRRWSSTSSTLTTTPSISKSSAPRRSSQARQRATTSSSVVEPRDVVVDAEVVRPCSHCSASQWLENADPLGRRRRRRHHIDSGRSAVSLGSSWRIVPAAELRGFMKVDRPCSARRSLSAAKSASDM